MWSSLNSQGTSETELAVGVALSFTATVLFCATPILVELVNSDVPAAKKLGSSDVGGAAAKLGAVVITLYVAVWTWPRKDQLVLQPLVASGACEAQPRTSLMQPSHTEHPASCNPNAKPLFQACVRLRRGPRGGARRVQARRSRRCWRGTC